MQDLSLADRAHATENWMESCFVDPRGVVYTYLDAATKQPVTDDFFAGGQVPIHLPGCGSASAAEWHAYENCGMTTAAYMLALLHRYEMEKDPLALQRAHRCFETITQLYNIGKQLEEGFFPKIYGNRFSEQTSTDQVLYVMLALDHFHRHAEPANRQRASRMITELIRFWMKRDYRYKYFWIDNMQWPLGRFTSLLLMGFKHSGDNAFRDEYHRLLDMGVNERPIESRLGPKLRGEVEPTAYESRHKAWLIGELDGAVSMDIMELDYLLRNDPTNRWADAWKRSTQAIFDEGKLVLANDGTMYVHVLVDMKTGKPRRPEPEFFRESQGADDWIGFRHVTGGRSGDSTFIARAAVQAYPHLKDPAMKSAARLIISSIGIDNLYSYMDPDRLLPELRHRTQLLSGDGVTNWLWAYWQGRAEGIFSPDE